MSQYVVGLTGGIGSGKSASTAWFANQGVAVIDADQLAKLAVAPGSTALLKIQQHFGDWVLNSDQELDRAKLREFVFSDPKAKEALESFVHPEVHRLATQAICESTSTYVVLAAPLLFEHPEGLLKLCTRTLCIDVPESLQIKRASERDGQSGEQIQQIIRWQISREQRVRLADDVVDNSGSLEQLHEKLGPLHSKYQFEAKQLDESEWAK